MTPRTIAFTLQLAIVVKHRILSNKKEEWCTRVQPLTRRSLDLQQLVQADTRFVAPCDDVKLWCYTSRFTPINLGVVTLNCNLARHWRCLEAGAALTVPLLLLLSEWEWAYARSRSSTFVLLTFTNTAKDTCLCNPVFFHEKIPSRLAISPFTGHPNLARVYVLNVLFMCFKIWGSSAASIFTGSPL